MSPNPLLAGLEPTHPGELLREDVLPALGRSKVEIATALGVSRRQLYNILDEEQPITPQMALRIGKLTGTTPESWLAMQQNYDLRVAESAMADDLAAIPFLEEPRETHDATAARRPFRAGQAVAGRLREPARAFKRQMKPGRTSKEPR